MAALSSSPFVCVAKVEGALQLSGEKSSKPLKSGQTIAAHGMFDDQTETQLGFFVVLKCSSRHHVYDLVPVGCIDPYWSEHLKGKPSVIGKVRARVGEKVDSGPNGEELLTRWQILAEPGEEPTVAVLGALGKVGAEEAIRKWNFLAEYIVSDQQAGNESSRGNKRFN